jgi:hypothetical protein
MSADGPTDLRQRNRLLEEEVARLPGALAAQPAESGRVAGPPNETAFGRAAARVRATIAGLD